MSIIDEALIANVDLAADYDPALGGRPAPKIAIVTCADPRLSGITRLLGLKDADVDMIRNVGTVIDDDAVRSLIVSTRLLGTSEIMIINHNGCGLTTFTDEELDAAAAERDGIAAHRARPVLQLHRRRAEHPRADAQDALAPVDLVGRAGARLRVRRRHRSAERGAPTAADSAHAARSPTMPSSEMRAVLARVDGAAGRPRHRAPPRTLERAARRLRAHGSHAPDPRRRTGDGRRCGRGARALARRARGQPRPRSALPARRRVPVRLAAQRRRAGGSDRARGRDARSVPGVPTRSRASVPRSDRRRESRVAMAARRAGHLPRAVPRGRRRLGRRRAGGLAAGRRSRRGRRSNPRPPC